MSKTFFTSDNHWGHKRIIDFCNRPFSSVEEMNQRMIQIWNAEVTNNDTVYILGDMFFKMKFTQVKEVLDGLNGNLHLIRGNHEEVINKNKSIWGRFEEIVDYKEIRVDCPEWFTNLDSVGTVKIVMFHFPIFEWNKIHFGAIHLHGHLHGKHHGIGGRIMDVGADTNEFKPYELNDILRKMNKMPIRNHDL